MLEAIIRIVLALVVMGALVFLMSLVERVPQRAKDILLTVAGFLFMPVVLANVGGIIATMFILPSPTNWQAMTAADERQGFACVLMGLLLGIVMSGLLYSESLGVDEDDAPLATAESATTQATGTLPERTQ